eukprot:TRINITY_DN630_c0_g2_i2.p1 TRINITY_DN630_c0_g2~~TRINITY_DN630_c0_g2_i2.p1  ORF type:complete len:296 (+),score=56.84 TRINITY_DN630_c0_g2_i2:61-888(+)
MEKEVSDEEIRKAIWNGAIPIVFNISSNEITQYDSPDPYYILAPRGTYLPTLTETVQEHFKLATVAIVDDMWFTHKDIPIKWHLPVGVLFDLLGSPEELPWNLTVHFQGFPATLLRCPSPPVETVKSHFMNALKESNFIKYSDSKKINDLSAEKLNSLWDGLMTNDYDQFWEVEASLVPTEKEIKACAVRIVRDDKPVLQDPVNPWNEAETTTKYRTLGDVLSQLLPDTFKKDLPPSARAVIQGVSPPLNTPIFWLSEHCSHPDGFLYIVVKDNK